MPKKIKNNLQSTKWSGINDLFDLRTILGRLVLSTIILVAITLAIIWLAQSKFQASSKSSSNQLAERIRIDGDLAGLRDSLWKIETQFQSYMLVPENKLKNKVLASFDELLDKTLKLQSHKRILADQSTLEILEDFHEMANLLKASLKKIMHMRADPLLVFPAMPYMANVLNPASKNFTNTVSLALVEADELKDEPGQREIKDILNEMRFNWAQTISVFRVLISSRLGIFKGTIEDNHITTRNDISLYYFRVIELIEELKSYKANDQLGFQQSDAISQMEKYATIWYTNYKIIQPYLENDANWRKDTTILRDEISPLFLRLWSNLQKFNTRLTLQAKQDIKLNEETHYQISRSLWILVIAVLFVMVISTLLFEFQIRRPIIRISRALKAEAAGARDIELPESSISETRDLITAFSYMRQQVHSRQEHLQAVLTYAVDSIITTNMRGMVKSFNPAAEKMFGQTAAQAIDQPLANFITDLDEMIMTQSGIEFESYAYHASEGKFPIGLRVSAMKVDGEELMLVMIADIRERREMLEGIKAREQRLHAIMDTAAEAIVTFDDAGKIENWNRAAETLFGWREAEVTGKNFCDNVSVECTTENDNIHDINDVKHYVGLESEVIGLHKNGSSIPLSMKVSKMTLDGSTKYTALLANIAERKAMMDNLKHIAEHDSLTGLYNRAYFHDLLEESCEKAKSGNAKLALLYIDLDNFKYINDSLGHLAGDQLLVEISNILNMRARRSDLIARLGGDEFVAIINDASPDTIVQIAESYRESLANYTFKYEAKTVNVGCSIGVTLIDNHAKSPSSILAQGDVACHLAKRAGRNRIHVFTSDDASNVENMTLDIGWSQRIHDALDNDKFVLVAQPIFNTDAKSIYAYEILVRMLDNDGTLIMPAGFFSTAERFGLAVKIDMWVISHAIEHLASLNKNKSNTNFSINLSGQSITVPDVIAHIASNLKKFKVSPNTLTFEITETAAISDMDKAVLMLKELRNMGCRTALDDFGSGMSSFAYLQEMPVDIVKIDGRFVKNIAHSKVDQAIVRSMNEIAHALGKLTVAEFVENEAHYQTLKTIGVDCVQGYHLGKPASIDLLAGQNYKSNSV